MGHIKTNIYSCSHFGLTIEPTIEIVTEITASHRNKLKKRVLAQIKNQGFIEDALKAGISRRNISNLKKNAREGKPFVMKKITKKKLLEAARRKMPRASSEALKDVCE